MADEVEEQQQPSQKKGGKLKWIILGCSIPVIVAIGVISLWAGGLLGSEPEPLDPADAEGQELELQVNEVVNLDPVVVNLVNGSKMSYARIGLALGLHNPSPGQPIFNMQLMVPKVRDELLGSVGGMSAEELLRSESKEQLKETILAFVNELIEEDSGKVVEIYFTDFVVQ